MEAIAGGMLYCVPSCMPMTFLRTMKSDLSKVHATSKASDMMWHRRVEALKPSLR